MPTDDPAGFRIDRIGIRGGLGTGVLVALVVASMLEGLPVLRVPMLVAVGIGVLFGIVLILWRRRARPAPRSVFHRTFRRS